MMRLALVLLLMVITSEARAEGVNKRVLVVTRNDVGTNRAPAAQRLEAELMASGFEVEFKRFSWLGLTEMVEAAAVDPEAAAAITLTETPASRGGAGLTVDIWIPDRSGGKTVGRRVHGATPEQLSVRVVEALRAGLMEVSVVAEPEPEPVDPALEPEPTPVEELAPEPPSAELNKWRVSSGGALMIGGDSLGAAVGPQFRAAQSISPGFWLGVQVVAPLWGGEEQDASVSQTLLKAELSWVVPFAMSMTLTPAAGLGWYWLGRGRDGTLGPDNDNSLVASLGAGVGFAITSGISVNWDLQGMAFLPQPGVLVHNRGQAQPGVPAFLSSLGLDVQF